MADVSKPEELRFLWLWGLLRESVKVLLSHTKLFLALTLTLILPLCVVGLGYSLITEPIVSRMQMDEFRRSIGHPSASTEQRIYEDLRREAYKFLIVFVIYILILAVFSLLSTSAMVYSVACIYSEKVTSYKTVLSVVPRVWKRLIVTFLWAVLIMFSYVFVCMLLTFIVAVLFYLMSHGSKIVMILVSWGGGTAMFGGATYLSCVWHLASIVTVLEESYGIRAMKKSLKLIEGKKLLAICLFFLYSLMAFLIGLGFRTWVVHGGSFNHRIQSVGVRAVLGCVLILSLTFVYLMGFLVETVFYFSCKAHHHESIDRLQLSKHLGAYLGEYLGEYVPLRSSIQLEAFDV